MPTSPSAGASSNDPSLDGEHSQNASKRLPKWMPISLVGATTVALAIPLVYLARKRHVALRDALKNSSAPPPRRSGNSTARFAAGPIRAAPVQTAEAASTAPSTESVSPGIGELLGAVSRVDYSTAMFAGKAFGIATCLVGVGAAVMIWGVRTTMGVQDTREFAHRMRMAIWTKLPGLTSRIHRPPETEDELAGTTPEDFHDANWNWEDAEKRLQAAYEKGGFPAWAAMALKEMEAEGRIERARRQKEYELASGKEASS